MATRVAPATAPRFVPAAVTERLRRSVAAIVGVTLILLAVALALALASHAPADPSLDTATDRVAVNWLGRPGAWIADALLLAAGYAAFALLPALAIAGCCAARASRGPSATRRQRSPVPRSPPPRRGSSSRLPTACPPVRAG